MLPETLLPPRSLGWVMALGLVVVHPATVETVLFCRDGKLQSAIRSIADTLKLARAFTKMRLAVSSSLITVARAMRIEYAPDFKQANSPRDKLTCIFGTDHTKESATAGMKRWVKIVCLTCSSDPSIDPLPCHNQKAMALF